MKKAVNPTSAELCEIIKRKNDWEWAMFFVPMLEYETLARHQHAMGIVPTFMFIPGTKEGPRRSDDKSSATA